jgi:hypothetical protein
MSKYSNELLAGMNKGQLREAMRAEGLSYNGLNNEGMKEALAKVPATDAEVGAREASEPVTEQTLQDAGTPSFPASAVVPDELRNAEAPVDPPVVVERTPRVLTDAPVPAAPKAAKERKIQANRPEKNGVKRPSEGTICAQIWTWCDEVHKAGDKVTAKELRAALPELDDTTKTVQYYRWRKFNGIQGRS